LQGIKRIETHSVREKGARGYDIFTIRRDIRPDIAKAIVASNLELLDMHKEVVTLEEVFSQVTARSD
jgi:hypothetical protein